MTFETLLYDVEDRVATITLNRPHRRNAFDRREQNLDAVVAHIEYMMR